jgi:ABC-2 type transport system ATP-binding protein
MARERIVTIDNVVKDYVGDLSIRRRRALDALSLSLERGEVLGLLGPNGAGKSTTFKCLLGLVFPDAGRIELFGGPPGAQANRRIGYLPEQPVFYEHLSGMELMELMARLHELHRSERRSACARLLDRVGLGAARNQRVGGYSKGMQQRLGLAQALLHRPELLILDEPMSGLDPVGRREVRDLILELKRGGVTVLFSSHVLADAEMLCDRVAILLRGRVRREGSIRELAPPAADGYELTLAGAEAESRAAGLGRLVGVADGEAWIQVEDERALARALQRAIELGLIVRAVSPRRRSLEDTFLEEIRQAERDAPAAAAGRGT